MKVSESGQNGPGWEVLCNGLCNEFCEADTLGREVASPVSVMVAVPGLELDQVNATPLISFPYWSLLTALNCWVPPVKMRVALESQEWSSGQQEGREDGQSRWCAGYTRSRCRDVHQPWRYTRCHPAMKDRNGFIIRTVIRRSPRERNSGHGIVVLVYALSNIGLLFPHMN
jgi:hypothetical protein